MITLVLCINYYWFFRVKKSYINLRTSFHTGLLKMYTSPTLIILLFRSYLNTLLLCTHVYVLFWLFCDYWSHLNPCIYFHELFELKYVLVLDRTGSSVFVYIINVAVFLFVMLYYYRNYYRYELFAFCDCSNNTFNIFLKFTYATLNYMPQLRTQLHFLTYMLYSVVIIGPKYFNNMSRRHLTLLRRFLLHCKHIQITYSFVFQFLKSIKLKIGLLNPGSLGTKHDEFLVAMDRHSVDIMAINETWLRVGEEGRAPSPPGYRLRHVPRPAAVRSRGGGVGFYVRQGINARSINLPTTPEVEQMWLSISLNGVKLAIGTAYRPPWLSIDVFVDALSVSISSLGKFDQVLLLGDFNINLLNTYDAHARKLLDFLKCMNLTQYVDQPTHFTDHGESLIDVVCSDSNISHLLVDHIPDLSRHAFITCKLNIKNQKPTHKWIIYRPLKDINFELFNKHIKSISWKDCCHDSVDTMLGRFNNCICQLFDNYAPVRRINVKSHSYPWITYNVKEMIKLRNKAYAKYKLTKLEIHKEYYKQLKAIVVSAIHSEKTVYFNQHINKYSNNPRMLWKHIKRNIVEFKKKNFELPIHLNDPKAINEHFMDIPGNNFADPSVIKTLMSSRFCPAVFSLQPISEEAVGYIIKSIKTNAQGADRISLDMILLTLPYTLNIITILVNKSLETGVFPYQWKTAIVKPVPKTQNPTEFKDLRPISILPFLSKIVERAVCFQITAFIEKHAILPEKQSGFRKCRSTATALIDVVDDILAAQNDGEGTILALLDYSRAFDTINPIILLAKLSYYGFDTMALKWFASYLSERSQYVEVCNESGTNAYSTTSRVTRGVPQGSILGPILFILYTADIIHSIENCSYHLYADDLQMYISFKPDKTSSAVDKLNEDLDRVSQWSDQHNLVLNPTKSKYMILGSKKVIAKIAAQSPHVSMMGNCLDKVPQARNLGLLMDEGLRFEDHILEIMRNCFYRLKVLYRVRDYINVETRVKLCESLILSKLNYADTVFGGCLLGRTRKLVQRIQNACARYCFPVPRRSHITPVLNRNDLLNMSARYTYHFASLLFGVVIRQEPSYLYKKLKFSQRAIRITPRLMCPRYRTAAFRGSFRYAATKCWNNLPPPIKNSKSLTSFKHRLRIFLLDNQKSTT
jgi:hypothetical protein